MDDPNPGPSATAVALELFYRCTVPSPFLQDGLTFLKARQVASTEIKADGGWAVNTSFGHPVLEATSVVTRFLGTARVELLAAGPDIRRAVAWILNNQDPCGGWGSFYGQPPRTWLTGLALQALNAANPHEPSIGPAVDWLLRQRSRTAPTAWGESHLSDPTVVHTAFCLLVLRQLTGLLTDWQYSDAVADGYEWLIDNLDPTTIFDNASRVESYNITGIVDDRSVTWHGQIWHHGLPYVFSALMRHPEGTPPAAFNALATIVRTQLPDGHWPNVDGSAPRSIWDVYPFIVAISDARTLTPFSGQERLDWLRDDTMLARRGKARNQRLETLGWKVRSTWLGTTMKNHWATILLIICIVFSIVLFALNRVEVKDIALGLLLPLLLFFVQEGRRRRRQ
ncbi:prenyltransferase/squalene oxidase repeat-containing protein [Nocardia sp. NPDC051570]|uniref:prenyltransferase/squalene oxidase repeat-containing protein n=1 Tax=Nocardia sp. NPDC051570 TaxID=3364324 RepID=UPI0037B28C43